MQDPEGDLLLEPTAGEATNGEGKSVQNGNIDKGKKEVDGHNGRPIRQRQDKLIRKDFIVGVVVIERSEERGLTKHL